MEKIFISAVSQGLKSYRNIAAEVVQAHSYIAVAEEYFRPPTEPMMEDLKRKIDACKGVVAIIGPYYGSKSGWNCGHTPMSFAQFEFHYALKSYKPCLVLIAKPDFKAVDAGDFPEQPAEDADLQRAFINKVKSETRCGWTHFGNPLEFAAALAKHPWKEWLNE